METKVLTTQDVILSMMQENTGSHFLDSGSAYGRNHERNRSKTWEDLTKNPVRLEASVYTHGDKPELELMGYISLAAWLEANLTYDHEMQECFEEWLREGDRDYYDLEAMELFADWMTTDERSNKYGFDVPRTINSYNGECDLSQTIQFVEFQYEGEGRIMLQIHGGCDVRGGYTSPRAFKLDCDYFGSWMIDGYGCNSHQWDESLNNANDYKLPNLKDYPVHELEWVSTLEHDLECLKQTDHDNEETREAIRVGALTAERDAFEEFCDALTEHSVVVWKRVAYFVGDDGPEEICGDCYGMYN